MEIIWSEREHEDMDREAIYDPFTFYTLRRCGLLKLFFTMNMRDQPRLLETLMLDFNLVMRILDHLLQQQCVNTESSSSTSVCEY